MRQSPSSWPWWQQHLPQIPHSNEIERRVVTLEIHKEDQEEINRANSDRMKWLERGLQALAGMVLMLMFKMAPTSAAAFADIIVGMLKR